jgi:hypothetical protein
MALERTIMTVVLLSATPAAASPSAPHVDRDGFPLPGNALKGGDAEPPRPPPDSEAPKRLLELRAKLHAAGRDRAWADLRQYRPLCDASGYPLVGNVASKGEGYQPSEFCAEVRKGNR